MVEPRYRVHICHGPNCTPRGGAARILTALEEAVRRLGIKNDVEIIATSCRNRCELGPSVNVYPGPVFYGHVDPEGIERIAEEHLLHGRVVRELVVKEPARVTIDFDKLGKIL
jgi:(2Fe-2S) ferredoxin